MKKYLLDTAPFLWMLFDEPEHIPPTAIQLLTNPTNTLMLSAASTWEIAIKYSLGKLKLKKPPERWLIDLLPKMQVTPLPIHPRHTLGVAKLPWHHRDPFDRLLVAQALQDRLSIISPDTLLDRYHVERVWK